MQDPRTLGLAGPAHGAVERVRDGATGVGQVGEEVVGVAVPEQGGDGVVVLAAERVRVHDRSRRGRRRGRRGESPYAASTSPSRPVREPGLGQGAEDGHAAQAPVGLLELRLDGLGEVAVAVVARGQRLGELRQPLAGVGAPVVADRGAGRGDDLGVAGDAGEVEQARRRP